MRSELMGGLMVVWFAVAGCVAKPRLGGPLPVRNQHPAQLTILHMDPAAAEVLPAGRTAWRTDVGYTSLFLNGVTNAGAWTMDGELLRTALNARIGLGAGLELSTQLAIGQTSGGFLDNFIIGYHEAFGFPDQNRSNSPKNDFLIDAQQGGSSVWSVEKGSLEWLDLPIQLTWQLQEPGDGQLGMAVRTAIELPLGDQDRGYGNGQVDFALGALFDYRVVGVGLTAHVQHTFAGTPRASRRAGFTFSDVTSIGLGAELPLSRDLHAIVQAEWETSTLRDLGPQAASREQVMLWVGGRYQVATDWAVELGFGEDLVGLVSPDFTAWFSMVWEPGR